MNENVSKEQPNRGTDPDTIERGTVKWFDRNKRFGRITAASGEEVFFHEDSIESADYGLPCEQDAVLFKKQTTSKGLSASNVWIEWNFGIIKTFRLAWTVSGDDLKDAESLAMKLKSAADPVSSYIFGRLSEHTRLNLTDWQAPAEVPLGLFKSLVADLNACIKGSSIWDGSRFANVTIPQEAQDLLDCDLSGGERLARLNRVLLESAYPAEFRKTRLEQWDSTFSYGFIQQSSTGQDVDARFDIRELCDHEQKKPAPGDYVAFSQIRIADNKASVRNVNRVRPKFGIVREWNWKKGQGSLTLEGSQEALRFSRDGLLDRDEHIAVGDAVSFVGCPSPTGLTARWIRKTLHLYQFAVFEDEDEMLRGLAEEKVLEGERWDYKSSRQYRRFQILWSYLFYTFEKLHEEDRGKPEAERKIRFSQTKDKASFNTGLVDKMYRPIFAGFSKRNRHKPGEPLWEFECFVCKGELVRGQSYMSKFATLPERAQYFSDPKDVVFNTSLRLDAITEHIVGDRGFRLPKKLRDRIPLDMTAPEKIQAYLSDFLRLAIDRALERVKWNYKTAIPQYYFEQSQLQLLLPLCIDDPRKVDLALAIHRDEGAYVGRTILELDWAYSNARLIARPDSDWLSPSKIQNESDESSPPAPLDSV